VEHVNKQMYLRSAGWGGSSNLHLRDAKAICHDYHVHGPGQHCHKALDRKHSTKEMIKDIFSCIKADTSEYIDETLEHLMEDLPHNRNTAAFFGKKYQVLRWSRRTEEEVALLIRQYEQIIRKMIKSKALDGEVPAQLGKKAQRIGNNMQGLRKQHNDMWLQYQERYEMARWDRYEL
jgi:hypothetical protein